jgi:hypothetical protein
MLTKKIALSVTLVLATASAAMAAPKYAVRHQTATEALRPAEGAGATVGIPNRIIPAPHRDPSLSQSRHLCFPDERTVCRGGYWRRDARCRQEAIAQGPNTREQQQRIYSNCMVAAGFQP